MTTRYRELFRIGCRHGYFAGLRCPLLQVRPTAECSRLLDRYGCLFKAGAVYYSVEGGQSLLRLFDETEPFAFSLDGAREELDRCTELPHGPAIGPAGSLYYFNNAREERQTIDDTGFLLLHAAGKALADGPLPVRPAQFVYTFSEPVTASGLRLFDAVQRPVDWENRRGPDQKSATVSLNFNGLAPGRYRLSAGMVLAYDFYLSPVAPAASWGIVEVFAGGPALADRVPEACRLIDAVGAIQAPLSFTILLDARLSFWRYIIVSQSTSKRSFDDYRVVAAPPLGAKDSAIPIQFTPPLKRKVGTRDCWVFESTTAIRLYEVPRDRYEVRLQSSGRPSDGVTSFALPYARGENTMLEETEDGARRMWSEIYVNL